MQAQWYELVGHASRRWEWFKEKATTKSAYWWLGAYSFFETILIPFPTDVFLAVMVHTNRARAVWVTVWTTLTSLAAAIVGYAIAYGAYETLGQPLAAQLGIADQVVEVARTFDTYTFAATFIGAFSPIPFAPIILAAGLLKANVVVFIVATVLGRGLRFSIVSFITVFFGVSVLPRLGKIALQATIGVVLVCILALALFIVF